MKKRILSMLLVIVMVLSMVPVSALATGEYTITSAKGSVVVGEELELTADGAAATDVVKWTVTGDGVVKLSSDTGSSVKMLGQRQGKVTVKAESGTKSGTRVYTVYQKPSDDLAIIDKDTGVAPVTNLTIGDKLKLDYTCTTLATITEKSTRWETSAATVVNVNSNGELEAMSAGEATVTLRFNGGRAELKFVVSAPVPKKMTVKADEALYSGKTVQLRAYGEDNTELTEVKWSCPDSTIAVVGPETGALQCLAARETKIVATKDGYEDFEQTITILENKLRIVDPDGRELTACTLYKNDKLQLKAVDAEGEEVKNVTWDSSAFTTAAVDATGLLSCDAQGTAKITVKANVPGYTDGELDVTVQSKASFLRLRLDDLDRPEALAVGETRTLMALKDTSGVPVEGVKWEITSGNDSAVLDGDQLTGTGNGDVELTATCDGFEPMKVTIHVTIVPLESVAIPGFPTEMNEGQEMELSAILAAAQFTPAYATDKTINFTSCNKDDSTKNDIVAIVDGKLVAKKFGTAIVTGTYAGSKTISFEVKVKAAKQIVVDPTMPLELICGGALDLKAVLKNVDDDTVLETPVQWRLKNDKVIKNLVDLTANKLTAYPQSTYDFNVELEAFIEGNDQVEVAPVTIHVIPRTVNIVLKKGTEDISDKTTILNVSDAAGIRIDAVIKPDDSRQIVSWQVKDPDGVCQYTPYDNYVEIKPVSSQKTGSITVIATATDGTTVSRETRIEFARMADNVLITNAPAQMRGGANLQLRTNLDEDKTLTDRRVEWSVPEEYKQLASVTADGFLDTAAVTERTPIQVKATLIANRDKFDVADIMLCPSVKTIKIMQKVTDEGGIERLTNVKNVVDYTETVALDKIAYPAGSAGFFVWKSHNTDIAEINPETGVLTPKEAGRVHITCTAYDTTDFETAKDIADGKIKDNSKVMAIGTVDILVVKAAGFVEIEGATELISGKNTTLKATVYTDDGETLAGNQKVTWSVEDVYGNPTKAATINSRGRLYAKTVNYGTEVVVYATSVEDKEVIGEFHVNILPKKEKAFAAFLEDDDRIIEAPLYMNTNETAVISGRWYIREFNDFVSEEDCLFFSSNPAVATIGQNDGALATKKNGSTTITVRATDPDTRNVYTAKFTLYVVNTVDHIVISKYYTSQPNYVRSGSYMYLSSTVWSNKIETIKADNQGVTWGVYEEDSGELVATKAAYMTSSGALVANSVTENKDVIVVATSKENPSITAEFPMTIRPAKAYTVTARCMDEDSGDMVVPTGAVNLEAQSKDTPFGTEIDTRVYVSNPNSEYDGKDLPGAAIVWETSNKDIVKVVGGHLVYTGKTGKVKVTPTFKAGNVTYRGNTVTLNIMKFVDSVEVSKKYANQELYSGKSLVMYAKVDAEATTRRVTWSLVGVGDSDVASINATTGLIRARKGLTKQETITVQAMAVDGSGASDEMPVTIYPLATRVAIEGAPIGAIEKGDTVELTAVLFVGAEDDQANQDAVKWTSSRSSVVYVDKTTGEITAKRKGTATIKASATDGSGKYATVKVTVK